MKQKVKLLKKNITPWINLNELFPNSKLDFKRGLTNYQEKKIKWAFNQIAQQGNIRDVVPIRKGAKQYAKDHHLPLWQKTIFLSGGQKLNAEVEYHGKELTYIRGEKGKNKNWSKRSRFQIDTFSEETVIKSTKEILKSANNRKINLTANGRVMHDTYNMSKEVTVIQAVSIFNKYAEMSELGLTRTIRGSLDPETGEEIEVLAAHPSKWGMGVLFEPRTRAKKAANVKRHK